MDLAELFIGQLPEAIYFILFMIFTKQLKDKRIVFSILTVIDYISLLNLFPYSIWSHILFFVCEYCVLKVLYKEKVQVTDIFTLAIASIVLILINIGLYFIVPLFTNSFIIYAILVKIISIVLVLLFNNKLYNIQKLYKKLWNRPIKSKVLKSLTFRSCNLVIFNIMFYIIHICMIYAILYWR